VAFFVALSAALGRMAAQITRSVPRLALCIACRLCYGIWWEPAGASPLEGADFKLVWSVSAAISTCRRLTTTHSKLHTCWADVANGGNHLFCLDAFQAHADKGKRMLQGVAFLAKVDAVVMECLCWMMCLMVGRGSEPSKKRERKRKKKGWGVEA